MDRWRPGKECCSLPFRPRSEERVWTLPCPQPAFRDSAPYAVDSIGHVLDAPPALAGDPLEGDTRLTGRWAHGALHDALPGLSHHVVMTYYGADHDIVWRTGGRRQQSVDLLCLQLIRGHSSLCALPERDQRGGLADWQVRRVTDYMRERLDEEIGSTNLRASSISAASTSAPPSARRPAPRRTAGWFPASPKAAQKARDARLPEHWLCLTTGVLPYLRAQQRCQSSQEGTISAELQTGLRATRTAPSGCTAKCMSKAVASFPASAPGIAGPEGASHAKTRQHGICKRDPSAAVAIGRGDKFAKRHRFGRDEAAGPARALLGSQASFFNSDALRRDMSFSTSIICSVPQAQSGFKAPARV